MGDAGHHEDPLLAHGISDAFRDAELLAEAIDAGLSGAVPLDDALAGYGRRRDRAARPGYELTIRLASLEPAGQERIRLLRSLDGPGATDRFLGVLAGSVPAEELFPDAGLAGSDAEVDEIAARAQDRVAGRKG